MAGAFLVQISLIIANPKALDGPKMTSGLTPEEFEEILIGSYDRLFGVAFRILGSKEDAEDVVQGVCLEAPTRFESFRAEASCTTWLYRIAVNRSIDMLRARRRRSKASAEWGEVEGQRRAEISEQQDQRRYLAELMTSLEDADRALLSLLMVEGMTQAEVSEALDIPAGTVGWRVSQIKDRMRAVAEKGGYRDAS